MKIGLIGTGKMGTPLALNAIDNGHEILAFARSNEKKSKLNEIGVDSVTSYETLCKSLAVPRKIWIMVPSGNAVDEVIVNLLPHLSAGDILIDAGNSNFNDTLRRSKYLHEQHIHFLDVGTSGGIEGARHGACLMIGGDERIFTLLEPFFRDISIDGGYGYMGVSGSGHYVKMVHNAIEYGMMQSIGEGFDLLKHSEFKFDYENISRIWSNGSIIEGLLMRLTNEAFKKDSSLENIEGKVNDSGEGRWAVEEALRLSAYTPVLSLSLLNRFKSRDNDNFSEKVISALRAEFGGHKIDRK
jgi:6-phosphogluconate dehydrogenase